MSAPTLRPFHLWLRVLSALLFLACSGSLPSLAASSPASDAATDSVVAPVVAKVAGEPVTLAQAEAQARGELAELDRKRHEILQAATQLAVAERLIEMEAESRGLPVDAIEAEIEAAVLEVNDQDISVWYQRNQARIRAPKEQVAGQIRSFLEAENEQEARADKVAELSQKYDVEILLEPLRFDLQIADAPSLGPEDAAVTVVEYGDFQCPPCGRVFPELKKLKSEFGDRVRFVFEHFPLESIHPRARPASRAAYCAGEQGEFWGMHDALFGEQSALADADFVRHAQALELDVAAFESCVSSEDADAAVDRDLADGRGIGVGSTPSLFVNGRPLDLRGSDVYPQLKAAVEDELANSIDG